jgi:outer membrane receptor protein involved in Fe transport
MNGVEASAYAGTSQHADSTVYDLSILGGASSDKGGFILGAGYYQQKLMFAGARDWATRALAYDYTTGVVSKGGSSAVPQGRVNSLNPSTNCPSALCTQLTNTWGPTRRNWIFDPNAPACSGPQSSPTTGCQAGGWRPFNNATDLYNYQAVNYLITPSERISFFGNGEYHVSDSARVYTQATFVNRQSSILLAPEPLFTINDGITVSANNQFNPFGRDLSDVRRRLVELSGRSNGFDLDTIRVVAGIDGTMPEAFGPAQGWYWDVSFNYGRNSGITTYFGSLNTQLTGNGLGPSFQDAQGVWRCGTAAAPIAGCTPVDLFHGAGTITPAMATSLGLYKGINQGWNQQAVTEVNLSGELFKLMSDRPAGLALGYKHRNEWGGYIPNSIAQAGLDTDFNSKATQGSFYVNEGYAELDVPIISHAPLAEEVEVQGAVRVYDYNTFGSGATYKFGARWRLIPDFTVRGTYSTGFRAPGVPELYSGQAPNFPSQTDPCDTTNINYQAQCGTAFNNGGGLGQIPETVGGNRNLKPEKAKIWTIGGVFEPTMVRGFSLTVDYYNIKITNALGTPLGFQASIGAAAILHACYPGPGLSPDPAACALITRDASGVITDVKDLNANQGEFSTSGIDLSAQYTLPTDYGRFLFRLNSTYLIFIRSTPFANTPISGKGNYDLGVNPALKFNAGINYALAGLDVGVLGRYIGPFTECADSTGVSSGGGICSFNYGDATGKPFPTHNVPQEITFDVFAAYKLRNPAGVTTFTAGVRNLFNTSPVTVFNSFLTYADAQTYDFVGRYFFGRITHAF